MLAYPLLIYSGNGSVDMDLLKNITQPPNSYVTDGNLLFNVGDQFYMAYDFRFQYTGADCQPGRVKVNGTCGTQHANVFMLTDVLSYHFIKLCSISNSVYLSSKEEL